MADYHAKARSNYFLLRDEAARSALADFAAATGMEVITTDDNPLRAGLVSNSPDGSWPSSIAVEGSDEVIDLEVPAHVSQWLAEGSVAIFMEVSAENLRYFIGYTVAINSRGEERTVSLSDIYEQAGALGADVTQAAY
ncbi:hypothetical protein [Kineococcus radiotolerans]|uniref:Uncharacterized protein n=1 Tax=Kineococcus radiotolerans (strain ATCC BAA-149 / DSM 14245 / SRS30216) TaxID=266940 RepID=A6WH39_KINRD|nr:hypothetical protein [Kineococcus radiotolerans]ABS06128.1 hypothetical protein Krad_4670 [Kineococcus radiotolerans SRS30216 = ATCC BAA-149]